MSELKIEGTKTIKGKIIVETGLHIGGPKENVEIGGIDCEVVKDSNGKPYIPGSSLKGKLRHTLELKEGKIKGSNVHVCDSPKCYICKIFGSPQLKEPTRIVVRDAVLSEEFKNKREEELFEAKVENVIDRKEGTAKHPRWIERVVPGVTFDFEIILKQYKINGETDDMEKMTEIVNELLKDIQNDYIGGNGSRGYGKIKIEFAEE